MPRILVADDQLDLLDVIQTSLSMDGYEIVTVTDGESALREATQTCPDLIILDIYMPVLSGLEVCAQLQQADPPGRILLISGVEETEAIPMALEAGATDYLAKPFELKELRERVSRLLAEAPSAAQ
jgi:DNA-binding response OmpR family regulator